MKGFNSFISFLLVFIKSKSNFTCIFITTVFVSCLPFFVSINKLSWLNDLTSTHELEKNEARLADKTIEEIVKIQNKKKFHSGLPTFKVEIWMSKTSSFYVCRFYNACTTLNGILLLHPSLQEFIKTMSHCTRDIRFMNSTKEFTTNSISAKFDLIGYKFPHYHIPHFVFDFLPSAIAHDVITDSSNERVDRICLDPRTSGACIRSKGSASDSTLRLAHFINERDMKKKISSWVPHFLTMFSEEWYFYGKQDWFSKENVTSRCFKSIIRFNHDSVSLHSQDWYRETKIRHYIPEMKPTNVFKTKIKSLLLKKKCYFKILIIDRKPWDGRNFDNVDEIAEITKRTIFNTAWNAVPTISHVFMEDLQFGKQVQEVQSADFIIGSHGAGLSNLIFAKAGTPVLEVYPFLYYPRYFRHLSSIFELKYSGVIAQPDTQTFTACAHNVSLQFGSPNMTKVMEWWNNSLDIWETTPQVFNDNSNDLEPTSLMAVKRRICLRAQKLYTPMDVFGRMLMNMLNQTAKCRRGNILL